MSFEYIIFIYLIWHDFIFMLIHHLLLIKFANAVSFNFWMKIYSMMLMIAIRVVDVKMTALIHKLFT